jgi:GAF domain-containing protein
VRDISQRKLDEESRKREIELDKALSQIMGEYLTFSDLEPFIISMLSQSGVVLGVSQVILARLDERDQTINNLYTWIHPDQPAQMAPWPKMDTHLFSTWREIVLSNEALVVSDLRETPYYETLKGTGLQSALVTPVYVNSGFYGALSINETRYVRSWIPAEVGFARNLADLLGRVIERHG